MPCHFSRTADRFADLIAAVDQPLMHAARAGRKELQLRRIPERRVQKIEPLELLPPLGRAQRLAGKLDQPLRIGDVVLEIPDRSSSGSGA